MTARLRAEIYHHRVELVRELRQYAAVLTAVACRVERGERPNQLGELASRPTSIDARAGALAALMSLLELEES